VFGRKSSDAENWIRSKEGKKEEEDDEMKQKRQNEQSKTKKKPKIRERC